MRSSLRMILVGSMVVALVFNPAYACHYCGGWGGYYGGYYGYGYDCGGCSGCGGCEVVVSDGCGGCDSCDGCDSCGGCDSCEGVVVEEHAATVVPEAAPEAPAETHVRPQQPATVDRPVDVAPAPAPSLPAQPEPEAQPVPPADDLFNGTEAVTPPATIEEPAAAPVTEPPVTEPPVTEPEAPAETPAEDDLFGGATEETTPPAETEAPIETPAETPTETPATDAGEDDLFGGATEETTPPADTETPPAEPPTEEAPADGETPKAEETDDIFGASGRILREKGGLASAEMRLWVDNTGTYSTYGRLVKFMDGHVRILKDNGRTTTVPLYRLSPGDLNFVNRQATAQKAERFQTAQVSNTMLRVAN
jgi:hypothetical protein